VWAEDHHTPGGWIVAAGTSGRSNTTSCPPGEKPVDGHRYIVRSAPGDRQRNDRPTVPACRGVPRPKDLARRPRAHHMRNIFAVSTSRLVNPGSLVAWDSPTARTQNVTRGLPPTSGRRFCSAGPGTGDQPRASTPAAVSLLHRRSGHHYSKAQNQHRCHIPGPFTVPCYITPTCRSGEVRALPAHSSRRGV